MICASAFQVESEAAFGDLAAIELVAFLQFVEERCEIALRAELDEKLRTIESEKPAPGAPADDGKGKKGGGGRKWLERLGLGDGGKS